MIFHDLLTENICLTITFCVIDIYLITYCFGISIAVLGYVGNKVNLTFTDSIIKSVKTEIFDLDSRCETLNNATIHD